MIVVSFNQAKQKGVLLSPTSLKPRDLIRDNLTVYVDSPGDYSKWCQGWEYE